MHKSSIIIIHFLVLSAFFTPLYADVNKGLRVAAKAGDLPAVEKLLTHDADINYQYTNGRTPLYYGCQNNDAAIVRYLLIHGADHNIPSGAGHFPIHSAALNNSSDVIPVLAEYHIDLDLLSANGNSPLVLAAQWDYIEVIEALLLRGADPEVKGARGFTPLMEGIYHKSSRAVDMLIAHGAFLGTPRGYNYGPLYLAVKKHNSAFVSALLAAGADCNIKTKREGWTPLMRAAYDNDVEIIRLLLRAKADVNIQDHRGETALYKAVLFHNTESAGLLLRDGADPNCAEQRNHYTPLHRAAARGYVDIVDLLLAHGADISLRTKHGHTPVDVSADMLHHEINFRLAKKAGIPGGYLKKIEDDNYLISGYNKGLLVTLNWYTTKDNGKRGIIEQMSHRAGAAFESQILGNVYPLWNGAQKKVIRHNMVDNIVVVNKRRINIPPGSVHFTGWAADVRLVGRMYRYIPPDSFPSLSIAIPDDIKKKWTGDMKDLCINDPVIKRLVSKFRRESRTYFDLIIKIWTWVYTEITYKEEMEQRIDNAPEIITKGYGKCGEFARVSIALFRAAGIPARRVFGLQALRYTIDDADHVWPEVYIPGIGWLSVHTQSPPPDDGGFKIPSYNYYICARGYEDQKLVQLKAHNITNTHSDGLPLFIPFSTVKEKNRILECFRRTIRMKDSGGNGNNASGGNGNNAGCGLLSDVRDIPLDARVLIAWILTSSANEKTGEDAARLMVELCRNNNYYNLDFYIQKSPPLSVRRLTAALEPGSMAR